LTDHDTLLHHGVSWHYIKHLTDMTHEWKRHACDAIGFAGMVVVEVMLRKAAKDTGSEREETGGVLAQIGREDKNIIEN